MKGLEITDTTEDNFLSVDLFEILTQIGSLVEESEWYLADLECFGESAEEMMDLADNKTHISGQKMLELSAQLTQIIDGIFTGHQQDREHPWIVIQSIDSSAYEVFSTDQTTLSNIKQHFKNVREISITEELQAIA
ncbi:MAG: hypothetical protein J7647_26835 [Cyanobacteria bacterium SBLK]|nr:hypothetical protein [Cyanobacteria bacterium SBLK]